MLVQQALIKVPSSVPIPEVHGDLVLPYSPVDNQSIKPSLGQISLLCSLSETCLDWLVRPETKMAHLRSLLIEPNAMLPCTHS